MKSKKMNSLINIITHLLLLTITCSMAALPSLLNSPTHTCIACICHTRTGCYSLKNCANYSISYQYWESVGAPTLSVNSDVNMETYLECMADDNCIINTIDRYVRMFSNPDCNCDDRYDCQDMLSLHLYGEGCIPVESRPYRHRYNNCARIKGLPQLHSNLQCQDEDS
ncbi:hypothetical protein AMK59_7102 [Oryctes borbonicus]|uniref:lysozyme n=1 Tax=Oryctes borbonicus TaxID=1629725 RepID=A0A0T6AUS4_9SCAR|nr:hypothetical protein AMK59_7102 [Oryctes borbonicus]